jgi:hypothetical protein
MPLNSKLNGDVLNKVVLAVIGLAVAGSWGFLTSRASDEDVKANTQKIEQQESQVKKRLRATETNVVRICQFLDRKDKDEGGPGLECKDPE